MLAGSTVTSIAVISLVGGVLLLAASLLQHKTSRELLEKFTNAPGNPLAPEWDRQSSSLDRSSGRLLTVGVLAVIIGLDALVAGRNAWVSWMSLTFDNPVPVIIAFIVGSLLLWGLLSEGRGAYTQRALMLYLSIVFLCGGFVLYALLARFAPSLRENFLQAFLGWCGLSILVIATAVVLPGLRSTTPANSR